MDIEATQGDGPPDEVEVFAGERAASLRRMFPANPSRPAAPLVINALPLAVTPPQSARDGRRRWPLVAAASVLVAAGAAGLVVALRSGGAGSGDQSSATAGPPAAAVLAPVASVSPGPEPGPASSVPRKSAGAASTPTGKTRTRATTAATTATGATATATPRATTATTVAKSSGPISAYGACMSSSTATFTATFTESFTFKHVFINSDDDTGTGFRVPSVSGGLGADYMIENGVLYQSTSRSWSWSQVRGVSPLAAQSGGGYTWRVALSALDSPDGLSVAFNGSGGSAEAYTPILDVPSC